VTDPGRQAGDPAVEVLSQVCSADADALRHLVTQLSSAPPATNRELTALAAAPGTVLFVARASGQIVGSLTLVTFLLMTGRRALIEDVVVDERERGRGIGLALIDAAVGEARRQGARTVDLTSRPAREAANRLYQRAGFERRETNVWRRRLDDTNDRTSD
jgi:ribosomal protein S18 acetylase RimI-like enzyme